MKVRMAAELAEIIQRQALAQRPAECCGLLVGTCDGGLVTVREVHSSVNTWEGDHARRFQIDPQLQLRLQRECRERRLDIIGSYHSHPQGQAQPSATDAEMAWPDLIYLIVAFRDEHPDEMRCWQFDEVSRSFQEVELQVE